jgi:hypothetical protein
VVEKKAGRVSTHVIVKDIPDMLVFSFWSVDAFVLRFAQPSAVRRAAEATRGRAFGARPQAFSRLGEGTAGDMYTSVALSSTACRAWVVANARCSSAGEGRGGSGDAGASS